MFKRRPPPYDSGHLEQGWPTEEQKEAAKEEQREQLKSNPVYKPYEDE